MSVIVKGMKMPKSCYECKLDLRTNVCSAFNEWNEKHPYSTPYDRRLPDCPLAELPEKHGRLIDADALEYSLGISDKDLYVKYTLEEDAPTVIEAEGE